jgi:hypothetical protein
MKITRYNLYHGYEPKKDERSEMEPDPEGEFVKVSDVLKEYVPRKIPKIQKDFDILMKQVEDAGLHVEFQHLDGEEVPDYIYPYVSKIDHSVINRISHISTARIYNKNDYYLKVDDVPGWRKNLIPLATGIAKCSTKDQFNKLEGRIKALARALRMMKIFKDRTYELENFHYDGHKIFAYRSRHEQRHEQRQPEQLLRL